jgi:hypothetical protein
MYNIIGAGEDPTTGTFNNLLLKGLNYWVVTGYDTRFTSSSITNHMAA